MYNKKFSNGHCYYTIKLQYVYNKAFFKMEMVIAHNVDMQF